MAVHRFTGCGALVVAAAAGCVTLAAGPMAQAGPVEIYRQTQSVAVSASAPGAEEDREERGREPELPPASFDESIDAESAGEGIVSRAAARLTTSFEDNVFRFAAASSIDVTASGEADPNSGSADAAYSAITLFTLDEPYRYRLTTNLDVQAQDAGNTYTTGTEFNAFEYVGDRPAGNIGEDILSPGSYRIFFGLHSYLIPDRTESTAFAAEQTLTLELFALDDDGGGGGGGGEPTPIPLPPAAWSGLALMGAGLLNRWRKPRRA